MKVKLRCKKCHYEVEAELQFGGFGPLAPTAKSPLAKIKVDADALDKILEACKGASYEELQKLGLEIDIQEWEDAQERYALKKFLEQNIQVCRELKRSAGEKYVVGTEPWMMGDAWKDVDLPSSEVKSMGVEDMRLVPGVTLQKKVYGVTEGRMEEEIKGAKHIIILDGSGSMIPGRIPEKGKIGKALMISYEVYRFCKRMNFKFMLAVFSDKGARVPDNKVEQFFLDKDYRASIGVWNGGTRLAEGLKMFTDEEYKDANVVIISDFELADSPEASKYIEQLLPLTNNFRIILVEDERVDLEERTRKAKELFPKGVEVLVFTSPVSAQS